MKNNDKELISIWNSAMDSANILKNFLTESLPEAVDYKYPDIHYGLSSSIKELDNLAKRLNQLYEAVDEIYVKSSAKNKKWKKKYKKLCKKK